MDEKEELRNEFAALAMRDGIEPRYADTYYNLLFEIATGLVSRGGGLLVVGIGGAQGTGKSTFAKLLATVMERAFEKTTLVLSLDDFYLTREEREALADSVHPMFRTRGVPGTHDTALLARVIADLKAGKNTQVPVFDKGEDDRTGVVPVMGGSLDVLIVEGWCWGALPEAAPDLEKPVNRLEAEQDPEGVWRRHVNEMLAGPYRTLFREADVNFFLAAPDLDSVFEWRWQQEQALAARSNGAAVMSRDEVRDFIMYYERITRRMLKDMPERANLTLYLDSRHHIVRKPR